MAVFGRFSPRLTFESNYISARQTTHAMSSHLQENNVLQQRITRMTFERAKCHSC